MLDTKGPSDWGSEATVGLHYTRNNKRKVVPGPESEGLYMFTRRRKWRFSSDRAISAQCRPAFEAKIWVYLVND